MSRRTTSGRNASASVSAVVDNVIFVADLLQHQAEGVGYIKVVVEIATLAV